MIVTYSIKPRKKKKYWCKLCGKYNSVVKLAICKHCRGDIKLLEKMVGVDED